MEHTIKLRTQTQVILFVTELQGQISDGFWENSSPHDHWEIPAMAKVSQSDEPGLSFIPRRGYKFHNKELLEVVGDRMIHYVKLYTAFPQLSLKDHHSYEFEDAQALRKKADAELDGSNFYWTKKIHKLETDLGMTLEEAEFQIAQIPYDFKALRKDLKEINLVFKIARGFKPKKDEPRFPFDINTGQEISYASEI